MILAIDPGPTESAYVFWDGHEVGPFDKVANGSLLHSFGEDEPEDRAGLTVVIEQVRSYGMPVGAEIFDTVHWSGRFHQAAGEAVLVPRKDVKMHLCGSNRAKDSNIIQALVDRFAYGQKNKGKGTKKAPGFFYGVRADIWQAFALGCTYYDLHGDG